MSHLRAQALPRNQAYPHCHGSFSMRFVALQGLLLLCMMGAFLHAAPMAFASTEISVETTDDAPIGKASLLSNADSISAGEAFFLALKLDMPEGWHSYWQNPGDSGLKTMLDVSAPEGFDIGPAHWPKPEVIPYDFLTNYGYHSPAHLLIPVTAPEGLDGGVARFTAKASWLVCKEVCIPESAELSIEIPSAGDGAARYNDTLAAPIAALPTPWGGAAKYSVSDHAGEAGDSRITFTLEGDALSLGDVSDVAFYAITERVISYGDEPTVRQEGEKLRIAFPAKKSGSKTLGNAPIEATVAWKDAEAKSHYVSVRFALEDAGAAAISGVASGVSQNGANVPADAGAAGENSLQSAASLSLLSALVFAFLGGIVLNVMPCVLPVLSLKILSMTQHSQQSRRAHIMQALSYSAGILATFAVIVGALLVLKSGGSAIGWGFQLQSPIFVSALIFILLLVGMSLSGIIHIPALHFSGNASNDTSLRGSAMTGVLTTLLATPCTAPFMAVALGFALTQPPVIAFATFMALGLGLAFPFVAISLIPAAQKLLPKPGAWMEHLRQFFAFPIYATMLWLLWVLAQQVDGNGVAIIMFVGLAIFFASWLAGIWRENRAVVRMIMLLMLALMGVSLLAVGNFASYQGAASTRADGTSEYGSLPNSEAFSFERLEALRAEGKPVFVNATAAWCLTCKVNERVALSSNAVAETFRARGIAVLIADWTNRDAEISAYLDSLGRSGVPVYAYYAEGAETPALLPQLLTPGSVIKAVQ